METSRRMWIAVFASVCGLSAALCGGEELSATHDPITRHVHISYPVPAGAPDEVVVTCSWRPFGSNDWHIARVIPFVSDTALLLATDEEWRDWTAEGKVLERRAAGLVRTVVFNPYPEAQPDGRVDIEFRAQIASTDGAALSEHTARVQADNSDVVYLEDWSRVMQKQALATEATRKPGQWVWRTDAAAGPGSSLGTVLQGSSPEDVPLPQLTYPLDLRGRYAIFGVCEANVRLTGDERADALSTSRGGRETLWNWRRMDHQHLVVSQRYTHTGLGNASVDYIKLVPLTEELVAQLEAPYEGSRDKFVAGYWEPYSWAFHRNIQNPRQHRDAMTTYRDARFSLVDSQVMRFGSKAYYETRIGDQLIYETEGDAHNDGTVPVTSNVGRMQQYTNALGATLRYCEELGLYAHANFGAGICYAGSPLQSDITIQHPEWLRGQQPRFELPEVRAYALSLIRESLAIGTPGVSIDFMRYPQVIDVPETATVFLRELRALTEAFSRKRGEKVTILVQFPGTGVPPFELFDYPTWAKERLVDFLCPSNDDERHLHLDPAPYLEAVRGTDIKVLPNVTSAGLEKPGPFLWRVRQIYDAGAHGMYIYQSDATVHGHPDERRTMRLLSSSEAVRRWWDGDARLRPSRSKGIYLSRPRRAPRGWRARERVRVWVEGVPMGPLELYLDGALVSRYEAPPYLLGTEERTSDQVVPLGPHELRVRVQDGDGWLEQTFAIRGGK